MTKAEVDRFRAVLTARVAELERFTRQRDAIAVERCADQLEEIQAASQRALAVFGTCQECDEDIHPKRLAAVPWAPCCIRCQEIIDSNLEEIQAPSRDLLGRAA